MSFYRFFITLLILLLIILASVYSEDIYQILDRNLLIMKRYSNNLGTIFIVIYFFSYIVLTTLSLPVALLLGLLAGMIFDLSTAIILISFASSIGATLAMLLSRYLFRDFVRIRYGHYLDSIEKNFITDGLFYLFALRMTVLMPYFIINLAFGLVNINILRFYIVTQLGMLPGSTLIIMIGNELTSLIYNKELISIDLVILLTAAGFLPIIIKKLLEKKQQM